MSVVNAGRVELDLVAIAKDQVSATLREVNAGLKRTKAEMDEAAGANRRLNLSTEGLSKGAREAAKPLNNLREGFENLRSNGLFVVSTFAAVGGAIVGLISHLTNAGTATQELIDRQKDFDAGRTAMERGIESLRERLGETATGFAKAYDAAVVGASDARLELQTLTDAIDEQRKKVESWRKLNPIGDLSLEVQKRYEIANAEESIAKMTSRRRELEGQITEFQRLNVGYLQQQGQILADHAAKLSAVFLAAATVPGFNPSSSAATAGAGKGKGGGGVGGGGMTRAQVDAEWADRVRRFTAEEPSESEIRALLRRVRRAGGGDEMDAADAAAEESRQAMADAMAEDFENRQRALESERQRVEDLAESYRGLGGVLSDVLSPSFNAFVNDLSETFAAMAMIEDSNERGVFGAGKLAKATFDLAAAESETAQGRFAWKAAGEAAEAISAAARYDFWAAGQHGAAAVAFGIAAATAGGSAKTPSSAGAAGAGGPSSLDRSGNGSGGGTVIYNVDVKPGTDPQAVVRALRATEHAARNTGPMSAAV